MNHSLVPVFFYFLAEISVCDSNDSKSRVIEGYEATSGQFPWAVLIICTDNNQASGCSGSLISENFVLTAAHCFFGIVACNATLGSHEKNSPFAQNFKTKFYAHSCYKINIEARDRYDIGIAELERKVEMINGVRPIRLPNKLFTIDIDSKFTTVGWGYVDMSKKTFPDVLRYAVMKQMPQEECAEVFYAFEDPRLMCAKSIESKMQICFGDSGGPLVYGSGEDAVQIAVNSFSPAVVKPCESPEVPQGFVLVAPLLDWIHGVMKKKSNAGLDKNCKEFNFTVKNEAFHVGVCFSSLLSIKCLLLVSL